jgi:hypothetical protein
MAPSPAADHRAAAPLPVLFACHLIGVLFLAAIAAAFAV